MSYTTIEDTPLAIDLVAAARDTGWSLPGDDTAVHSSCNAGKMYYAGFATPVAGTTYKITYNVLSISGGHVQYFIGSGAGQVITTPGFVEDEITASGSDLRSYFYSDANCVLQGGVSLILDSAPPSNFAQNTIAYSQKTKKWVSFYTLIPDIGTSMFTNLFTGNKGQLYIHESGDNDRNNFYGTQYQSAIQFVDNVQPALPKTFQSLSIQSNELIITTTGGIQTSLGQISELSSVDFIKSYLSDGVSSVNVQSLESVYAANFLRDKNSPDGLLNGDALRGNYLLVYLISTSNVPLMLYTINVVSSHSPIGSR